MSISHAGVVPPLTVEYNKARRNLHLVSALLLLWVLVGVEITPDRFMFSGVPIKIYSPDVIPSVLSGLIIFFAYRTTLEWLQCDIKRRSLTVARIDYYVANSLGILAIATVGLQVLLTFRFGNVVSPGDVLSSVGGITLFFTLTAIRGSIHSPNNQERRKQGGIALGQALATIPTLFGATSIVGLNRTVLVVLVILFVMIIISWFSKPPKEDSAPS